jgi:hypothetical protein
LSQSNIKEGREPGDREYRRHRRSHYLSVLRTAMQHYAARTGHPIPNEIELTPEQLGEPELALNAATALLKTEAAPARLFAAVLLEDLDAEASHRALELIKEDVTPVLVPFGNILTPRPARDIAEDLLADREICFVPPIK